MGERPQVLVVSAHSERGARAQLTRHLAAGAHNPGLQHAYATPDGARLNIRWGRAANVTVGEIGVPGSGTTLTRGGPRATGCGGRAGRATRMACTQRGEPLELIFTRSKRSAGETPGTGRRSGRPTPWNG
jgi:hypothetical protein